MQISVCVACNVMSTRAVKLIDKTRPSLTALHLQQYYEDKTVPNCPSGSRLKIIGQKIKIKVTLKVSVNKLNSNSAKILGEEVSLTLRSESVWSSGSVSVVSTLSCVVAQINNSRRHPWLLCSGATNTGSDRVLPANIRKGFLANSWEILQSLLR